MTGGSSLAVARDLEALFDTGTAGGLTDSQLLERFAARHDGSSEAAFEVLVLRHGPMVLRVCRNVLRDPADAEDAFQATFLVLVKRRDSIRRLESIGGWLYGVACRVAARARVEAARRRVIEERAASRVGEAVDPSSGIAADGDRGPVVQEEVRRLPGKYRDAVALYYCEGLTHEQAAAQLGCPLGTVRSRLARARSLLRRRLIRRGLASLAAMVAGSFDSASAGAVGSIAGTSAGPAISPELVHSTVRAAGQIAAGQAAAQVASGFVASVVQRVIWSMTMIKFSSVALGVIFVGLTAYGVGLAAQRAGVSRPVKSVDRIDGNGAGQVGELGQAHPDATKNSAQDTPAAKTAGRQRIYSNVPGQTTILKIVLPGSMVKQGDVICELDAASFKDQLINQEITTMSARAVFQNARQTREVAEIAVVEYQEGIYATNLAEIDGDIKISESELALAQDELNLAKANKFGKLPIQRLELAVQRAQFGLKKAQSRKKLLVDYTKGRTVKQLRSTVEKAHADELAKEAIWELELSKQGKLEKQIASCKITAPIDGKVAYGPRSTLAAGNAVGLRQLLFEITPTSDIVEAPNPGKR
jgi:RNA polymerase sigma factor (sigma-70 family)